MDSPQLSVLVAEVDQAGNVEEQLHTVVQHQQDETQAVQTERREKILYYNRQGDMAGELLSPEGQKLQMLHTITHVMSGFL